MGLQAHSWTWGRLPPASLQQFPSPCFHQQITLQGNLLRTRHQPHRQLLPTKLCPDGDAAAMTRRHADTLGTLLRAAPAGQGGGPGVYQGCLLPPMSVCHERRIPVTIAENFQSAGARHGALRPSPTLSHMPAFLCCLGLPLQARPLLTSASLPRLFPQPRAPFPHLIC